MTPSAFLGIDVGTTAVKATVVDGEGVLLGSASVEHPTRMPRPSWAEQDPDAWWTAMREALGRVAAEGPAGLLAEVGGVAVTSQAPTMLGLDRRGAPVGPALIWMDRRADAEAAALAREIGPELLVALTANRPDPFYVAPKIRWLRDHDPEAFARVATWVQINGYLAYRLTGEQGIDRQHASILGLRDLAADDWSRELLDACGVAPGALPPVRDATEVVGTVTAAAADATGLPAGIPVVAGTVDSAAAALEAGVVGPGTAVEMTGTSSVVVMPTDGLRERLEFITMASVLPGRWLLLAAMVATGASLRWIRDVAGGGAGYDELVAEAAGTEPGGLVFLPYLAGERSPVWDSTARGAFVGLTLGTRAADLVRAVLEGTAFALRHNLEVAAERGTAPRELRSVGGPAANDAWCRIKADATGVPLVRMRAATGASYGGALLAAAGTGAGDVESLARSRARVDRVFEPDPERTRRYDDLYAVYRSAYDHLRPDLAALATGGDA